MSLFDPLVYDTRPVAPPPGPPRRDRGERLFSNGTEARAWEQVWCEQCERDHEIHDESGPGCQLYGDEMFDRAERFEIVDGSTERGCTLPGQVVCRAFRQCDEGPCAEGENPERRNGLTYREWCAQARADCGPFEPVIPYEESL